MIAQQHTADEFFSNKNSQRARRYANRYLAELAITTDTVWRDSLTASYLAMLAIGHVNGRDGSLLKSPEATASEAAYKAYEAREATWGREAAAAIAADTYRQKMAQAVR
jgi:hypothetical protein